MLNERVFKKALGRILRGATANYKVTVPSNAWTRPSFRAVVRTIHNIKIITDKNQNITYLFIPVAMFAKKFT